MPTWLKLILTNGAVVGSVINLISVTLFFFNPQFPREIFLAVVAVINSIYAVFGVIVVFNQMRVSTLAPAMRTANAQPPRVRASPPADAATLGPDASSIHVGGNVKDSNVGAGGRDIRQG